jgi:Uma2 family endonuclease
MTSARRRLPAQMTADEFMAWPGDGAGGRYQLIDGELRAMSPASTTHGTIQGELAGFIRDQLRGLGKRCRMVIEPAVAVRVRANINRRVPDIGVSCAADAPGQIELPDPILLVEIVSPGNKDDTWDNVWAYTSIPTVSEILVVQSTRVEAEVFRRQADGTWPAESEMVAADGTLVLTSIGLSVPLRDIYHSTYLA